MPAREQPDPVPGLTDRILHGLYAHASGRIAYIDESYRSPRDAIGGNNTYYILTAVLVRPEKLAAARAGLRALAATDLWHTNERAKTPAGRLTIHRLTRYLATTSASAVVVSSPIPLIDRDGEEARAGCIAALLEQLCQTEWLEPHGLVVFEQRREPRQRAIDTTTINSLRRAGRIHTDLYVHQTSPRHESLLWAPDIVAWSTRRLVAMNETTYVEPLVRAGRYALVSLKPGG